MLREQGPDRERTLAVVTCWKQLARHADDCTTCAEPVALLASGVESHPERHFDNLCADGQPLFKAWFDAAQAKVQHGSVREQRRRLGLDQLSGARFRERVDALTALPEKAWVALNEIESDSAREAQIRAVEAAYRRGGRVVIPDVPAWRPVQLLEGEEEERPEPARCTSCGKVLRGAGPLCTECWRKANAKKRR